MPPVQNKDIVKLKAKLAQVKLPSDLNAKVLDMLERLEHFSQGSDYTVEYDRVAHYVDWVVSLPWDKSAPAALDLTQAKTILDKHHYGMADIKDRLLQYLSVLKLTAGQPASVTRAPILCLVGLVGTGKTTFAYAVAEALARPIARIPFGGMGSARDLRGQSRLHLEAEPGAVIKALRQVQASNPVILLDEIDRVADQARADIMGVLVELLDPEQNAAFVDHYLDYPFNLSRVLFIATANNTTNIATAVMDRLELLTMPSYTDQEKIMIGRDYLLPKAITEAGLKPEQLAIADDLWPLIVRPLGFDAGIRTLQRNIRAITLKLAQEIVAGKVSHLTLSPQNIKDYLHE